MHKIKVNDEVVVLTGKDKGKTGKVAKLNFKQSTVLVSGVNIVKKALKPTQENPTGGISEKEQSIHISNVALVSPKTKTATRVRIENRDGKKVRVAVKCGSVLN
jgi:large subunit ribosomal protein L24